MINMSIEDDNEPYFGDPQNADDEFDNFDDDDDDDENESDSD